MALMKKSQYDPDVDGVVEQADYAPSAGDADTVDGEHASAFEHVSNKGVANGYAPLDANTQVPVANLPDAVKTSNFQDVTASRAIGTTYQNTTGKHLLSIISIDFANADTCILKISDDNITFLDISHAGIFLETNISTLVGIVPPGWYYVVTPNLGTPTLVRWWEVTI